MTIKSDRRKSHPFLYLGIFVFCWWCLPAGVKIFTQSSFREFQAPLWNLTSRVDDLSNYWGHLSDSKKTLIAKGRELARLNSDLRLQQFRKDELFEEIKRIQTLDKKLSKLNSTINLNSNQNFKSVVARISIRKMSSWWQQMTIRKGQNYGFKNGNGVIFDGGIFGRVINVDSRSSEIEILTNPNFRIVAHFAKDSRPVTFQGNGIDLGGEPHGLVMDVPYDMNPSQDIPLQLVTSSLGGNFPKGIPIGLVYQLEGGKEGLFKTGKVFINPRITKVLEVSILSAN